MKPIHLSILIIAFSIVAAVSEDEGATISKEGELADIVGVWESPRGTLTLFPDRRFETGPGPKIEFGIWEESRDCGYYLRYRARNKEEAGLSRAAHFLFEQGEIVFNHDDEVERFEKVDEVEVVEEIEIQNPEGLTGSVGKIKLIDDFSKRVALLLKDFEKMKPGMSREEIKQFFPRDGGVHSVSKERFVHPECPFFKVDVEFDFELDPNDQNRPVWSDEDQAKKISKPYIEGIILD